MSYNECPEEYEGYEAPPTAVLRSGGLVSLRFVRIGEGKLKSQDGRWTLWRSYGREGSRPAHWTIYDNGKMADAGTYSQCRATALQRLEREAQTNDRGEPRSLLTVMNTTAAYKAAWITREDALRAIGIGFAAGMLLVVLVCSAGCSGNNDIESRLRRMAEKAYFEGQRGVLTGDVRIRWDEEAKCYRWLKSPWIDGSAPLMDISGIESQAPTKQP